MINFLKKSLFSIPSIHYNKIYLILFLSLLSVFIELVGIGMIIPILSIFVDNDHLRYAKFFFAEEISKEQMLITILMGFLFIYFCKFFLLRHLIYKHNELAQIMKTDLSKKIFENYLYKNYLFHVKNNSSDLIRNIQSEANIFCFQVIFPGIKLISEIVVFISITALLMIFNIKASIVVIFFFSIVGYILIRLANKRLKYWGEERQYHSSRTLKQLQQSFLSLKEVIINNLQQVFLKKFHYHDIKNSVAGKNKDTITQMPRLILELLGVTTFVSLIFILLRLGQPITEIFIIIGVFFFAAVRLLPAVAKIVNSIQSLRFNNPVVDLIYDELTDFKQSESFIQNQKNIEESNPINLKKIILKDLDFSYPNNKQSVFKNVNLEINVNDKVGLVGKTGVGKTTFINLLTGLIKCDEGSLNINEQNISEITQEWQKIIGYVPQLVSIIDENILFNIALENDENKINFQKLYKVLKIVDLYDHIFSLPKNIYELAGERGMKLSGGQCQRIGIARALYKDSQILILDEATNSLDEITENFILEKIFQMQNKTIFTISHRANSLKHCNKVFEIKDFAINKISLDDKKN